MLVFSVVLLVSWFDYVNAGRTSQMRVTWEVCVIRTNLFIGRLDSTQYSAN